MEQGARRAKELGVTFLETSAKSGHNVKKVCNDILINKRAVTFEGHYLSWLADGLEKTLR